jgi:hypothetical protein
MGQNLTEATHQGYRAEPDANNPYLFTSLSSDAWALGKELREAGTPEPIKVTSSTRNCLKVFWKHSDQEFIYQITYLSGSTIVRVA